MVYFSFFFMDIARILEELIGTDKLMIRTLARTIVVRLSLFQALGVVEGFGTWNLIFYIDDHAVAAYHLNIFDREAAVLLDKEAFAPAVLSVDKLSEEHQR